MYIKTVEDYGNNDIMFHFTKEQGIDFIKSIQITI